MMRETGRVVAVVDHTHGSELSQRQSLGSSPAVTSAGK
jgi:hypothetical protein